MFFTLINPYSSIDIFRSIFSVAFSSLMSFLWLWIRKMTPRFLCHLQRLFCFPQLGKQPSMSTTPDLFKSLQKKKSKTFQRNQPAMQIVSVLRSQVMINPPLKPVPSSPKMMEVDEISFIKEVRNSTTISLCWNYVLNREQVSKEVDSPVYLGVHNVKTHCCWVFTNEVFQLFKLKWKSIQCNCLAVVVSNWQFKTWAN